MAELTTLESKIGEVIGLAMASQGTIDKVAKLVEDEQLRSELERFKQEATEMAATYLGDDADGLDGFEFLTMAEAGEVGHWKIVGKLNEKARDPQLQKLVEWATPIQQRHFEGALQGSLRLAAEEDPNAPES